MSGFRNCPPGPRDEKAAITSPWPLAFTPSVKLAVAVGWAVRNATKAVPSARCTAGRKWLSVSVSWSGRLYRIMPAAPAWAMR